MIEDLLPPSPNWYCSRASDSNEDGLFAYATRNVIFLLDVQKNPPSFAGCLAGHSNRVTAVKFGSGTHDKHLCASAGDDGCVKLWDVTNKAVVNEHQFHNESKVTTVDYCVSTSHLNLIISGDEKGVLIWWNQASGENKEFNPEKRHIYCLASCPHDEAYVAVGYKTGLVLIVDISGKGQIIHKLRGHDEEIHSVCWSPALGENIRLNISKVDGDPAIHEESVSADSPPDVLQATLSSTPSTLREQGCLLISGSRDRTIRVWNTTQGKAVLTLTLPPRGGVHRTRERGDDGGKARVWLGLSWPSNKPRQFISSSYGGDIILWDLCKPGKQKWEYCGTDDGVSHNRIVFNITNTLRSPDMFITTSMDRQIICRNVKTLKTIWSIPTLGGFVYSSSACPLDPGCLALGVGDNMIRVWNTTAPGRGNTVSVLWQGIKSKVTALSWHPGRENCLAYGTDDGRIGIYNTSNQGKGPHLSSTFHKKTVYSLSWGPQCPVKERVLTYCLYSCGGDGIIYQHDPSKLGEDATNLNSLIRSANQITYMLPLRTDLSWRDDNKAVAIGNEDGSIEVLAAPSLLLLCTIQVHHKLINCLKWYPNNSHSEASMQLSDQSAGMLGDGLDGSCQSGKRYWLASGSNEPQVHVHDLNSVLGGHEPVQLKAPITGSFRTLNGHTLRITALSWSPHGDGRLVSASYDSTAQVWDVVKGEPVANFRGHFGRLFSVIWSVLDPDVIFTGGEDFCLLKWRVSKVQHTKPPTHKRNTTTVMQRSGKGKSASSAKSNKKRMKPSSDRASVSSTPPRSATPEPSTHKDAPPIPESQPQDSPSGASVLDTPVDVSDLRRLLEAKRLEIEKPAVAGDDSANDDGKAREMNDSTVLKPEKVVSESNDGEIDEAGGEKEGVAKVVVASDAKTTDEPDVTSKKEGRRKKKHKSLFPLSRIQDNRGKLYHLEDCVTLAQHKYSCKETELSTSLHPGVGDNVHLGLFADRRAAYAMFREEGNNHDEAGYRDQNLHLEMWKGNLAGTLTKAMECNQLNSFLVAMAPLGGYDMWLETTEAYARQLERSEDYTQAATQYLACNKIHKAIAVLVDNKLYREAVALASVRLSPFDPAFSDVYRAWASHLESEGNYGLAAKCYLTINQPANAVMLLARKSDIPFLAAALRVSCTTDQGNLTSSLMVRYLHECLMAGDWLEAQGLLTNHSSVLSGSLIATLHEVTVTSLAHQKLILGDLFQETRTNPWIRGMFSGEMQTMDNVSEWTTPLTQVTDQSPLLIHAVQKWFSQCGLDPSDVSAAQHLYNEVASVQQQNTHHLSDKQLLIELAFELTLGQLSIMMGGASKAVAHWLQAVVMCHDVGDMDIAKGILSLVLPEGVQSLKKPEESFAMPAASSYAATSLHAYYLFTVLYHLWWEVGNFLNAEKLGLVHKEDCSSVTHLGTEIGRGGDPRDKTVSDVFDGGSLKSGPLDMGDTSSLDRMSEGASRLVEKTDTPPTDLNLGMNRTLLQPDSDQNGPLSEVTENQSTARACCDVTCAKKETVLFSQVPHTNEKLIETSSLKETLCMKLKELSRSLLSEPHAKLRSLKGRQRYIQMAVGKLVAQHAREGQEGVTHHQDKEGDDSSKPEADNPESYVAEGNGPSATNVSSSNTVLLQEHSVPPKASDQNQVDINKLVDGGLVHADLASTQKAQEADTNMNSPSSQLAVEHPNKVHIKEKLLDAGFKNLALEASSTVEEEILSGEVSLPSNWDNWMADVKYSHPAVTYANLLEEQGQIMQDLKKLGEDFEVDHPFPDTLETAMVLLHICRTARHKMDISATDQNDLHQLEKNAVSWGLEHSWMTYQKELFHKHLLNLAR